MSYAVQYMMAKPEVADPCLGVDHEYLVELCRSSDEEQRVLDWWLRHEYDTSGAERYLRAIRLANIQAERRQRQRPKPPRYGSREYHDSEPAKPEDLVADLTEREVAVWWLTSEGYTQREIADELDIGKATVLDTLDRIQGKIQETRSEGP